MSRNRTGLLRRHALRTGFAITAMVAGSAHAQVANAPDPKPGMRLEAEVLDRWTGKAKTHWVMTLLGRSGPYLREHFERTDPTKPDVKPVEIDSTMLASLNQRLPFHGEYHETQNYNWPLVPGKTWSYSQNVETSGTNGAKMDILGKTDAVVKDWESVEVPAGKFKAIKVVLTQVITSSTFTVHQTCTYWYTPDIPYPIKTVTERTNPDGSPGDAAVEQVVSYSPPN